MSLSAVQTAFYDSFGPLFVGQLDNYGSVALAKEVRNYRTEGVIQYGTGLVKGTANTQYVSVQTPFGVKAPTGASVLADFVGIAVLSQSTVQNATNDAVTIRDTTMIPVAELGSGAVIGALVPAGVTIAHGNPVFMSVSSSTIPVGQFTNAAGPGLIALTGATWYGAGAAGTVARIKL